MPDPAQEAVTEAIHWLQAKATYGLNARERDHAVALLNGPLASPSAGSEQPEVELYVAEKRVQAALQRAHPELAALSDEALRVASIAAVAKLREAANGG